MITVGAMQGLMPWLLELDHEALVLEGAGGAYASPAPWMAVPLALQALPELQSHAVRSPVAEGANPRAQGAP